MRICGFHIDGFGIFRNQGVQDIPGGLVLFTGRNEGGKTTLMEFIRTVLFGFVNRKDRNGYQPLRGGNHGGRLRVLMQDGRLFTVERLERRSTITEDGGATEQVEPSEWLLSGIDRQTFERIFAIGLKDLEGLDVLSQEGVRGRLLAASTGIGAASVPSTMNRIDDELDNLLKSGRATKPRINDLVRQLRETNANIRELQGQAADYAELQRKRAQLEEQIAQNKRGSNAIRQRLGRIDQLDRAREPWGRLCEARKRVRELEYARNFPPNGLERFERVKKEIEDALREKRTLESEAKRVEIRLGEIIVDETLVGHRETIEALTREREKLVSALQDHPIVKSEVQQKEKEFQRKLSDLGKDWDPERLKQVDTSVQTRHRVQEFADQLDTAKWEYKQAQVHQHALEDAEQEAKHAATEAQRRWDALPTPSITDTQALKRRREAAQKIRSLFYQRDNIVTQLSGKRETQQEVKERLEALEKQIVERAPPQLPLWMPVAALAAGLVLAIVSAVAGPYTPGIMLGIVISLTGSGLVFSLRAFRKRQMNAETERIAQFQTDKGQMEKTEQRLAEEIGKLEKQFTTIFEERERIAQDACIEQPKDVSELEELEAALERAAEQLREWIEQKQKKDEAESRWHDACDQLKRAEQEVEDAYNELQRLKEEWRKWVVGRGFAETVHPEGFEIVLQMVENAQAAESSLQESENRARQMETYTVEVQDKVRSALNACGMKPATDEVGLADLDALVRALNLALKSQQERKDQEGELEIAHKELARLGEELYEEQAEFDNLLRQAGATDEEKFRRIADAYDEWREYIQQLETNNLALLAIAGNLEAQEVLEAELAETESLKLQLEKDDLEEKLSRITDQVSADEREIGGLKEKLTQMAQDERLSELLLKQRSLQEELADATQRWATLIITRHLLDQARGIYERERQPRVIQEATRFVNTMTNTPYRLVMPAGSDNIQLEDSVTLSRKDEIGWSSGLADQVYLAIRFGLAYEFAEHAETLPLILDDVLVKFDPDRQLGTAKVILDLARHHQILMFTCHPGIREITEKALEECHFRDDVPVTYYTVNEGTIRRE